LRTTVGALNTMVEGRPGQAVEGAQDEELTSSPRHLRPDAGQTGPGGSCAGKLPSSRAAVLVCKMLLPELGLREYCACWVLGLHRSMQRKVPTTPGDEAALTADIIALAIQLAATAIAASRCCCSVRA